MEWKDLLARELVVPDHAVRERVPEYTRAAWDSIVHARAYALRGDIAGAYAQTTMAVVTASEALAACREVRLASCTAAAARELCEVILGATVQRVFERVERLHELTMLPKVEPWHLQEAKRSVAAASELVALVESYVQH